ncbi:glycosyltransferase family 4 protein [Aeromicrobium endophyticum]|uniref:glycosyltransferase family 4 protein n=1 Tax=Aeromicrobium endophyticum TaxID=2292704 RepID=UPI001314D845|nr:glycosyltransferase family 4 protein [Aeromicrobium endophyticum]
MRHVVVTYNGEPVALAATGEPRPDVHAAHPRHESSGRSGWTVEVDYPRILEGPIDVGAYALVETDDLVEGELGLLTRFAAVTVLGTTNASEFGAIAAMDPVLPGFVSVSGTATHPGSLARVEVTVAGGRPVRARHSLPGRVHGVTSSTGSGESDVAGFQAFVEIPRGEEQVVIAVEVTGADGTTVALNPIDVSVEPPPPDMLLEATASTVTEARAARHAAVLGDPGQGPRRILVATHDLGIGGAQLYLHLVVEALIARGVQLCVVSGAGGPLASELEGMGVPVLVTGPAPIDRAGLDAYVRRISTFAEEQRVVGGLANTILAYPAVRALQQLGLPTTWAIHESFEPASFFRQYYGERVPDAVVDVALDALRRSDEVVFVAGATLDLYRDHVPAGRAFVVPYGVDLEETDAYLATHDRRGVRADLGLDQEARVLVCVGMVEPRKGQLALVRAFSRLPDEVRERTELVLVGMGAGPYADAIRRFVETAALQGVRLVDVDRDVLRWHVAADVLVSASDVESLPRTMLEAMAVGRPVAATAVFGVGELVVEGSTGFVCEPLDLVSLTDMLRRVIGTDQAALDALGAAASDLVRERHDPDGYVRHFADRVDTWLASYS